MDTRTHRTTLASILALIILLVAFVVTPSHGFGVSTAHAAPVSHVTIPQIPHHVLHPANVLAGDTSKFTPTMAVWGTSLMLAYTGTDSHLNLTSSRDGGSFSPAFTLTDTAATGPAVCLYQSRFYVIWAGTDNPHHLNVAYYISGNHVLQGKVTLNQTPANDNTSSSVACTVYQNKLWLGWIGHDNGYINLLYSSNPSYWADANKVVESSNVANQLWGPSGLSLTVDPSGPGRLLVGWEDGSAQIGIYDPNVPHSLGSCATGGSSLNEVGVSMWDGNLWSAYHSDPNDQIVLDYYSVNCNLLGSVTPANSQAWDGVSLVIFTNGLLYYAFSGVDSAHTINVVAY
jgi:hypothetical protein